MEATRIVSRGEHQMRGEARLPTELPLERVALVALVFGRERAAALLEGLTDTDARRARNFLVGYAALSLGEAAGPGGIEFGVRPDAASRLRALMREAPETLRKELFRRLPAYHRSLFPERQLESADATATRPVCAWAERLIREATR